MTDVDEQLAAAKAELAELRDGFRRNAAMSFVALVAAGGCVVLQLLRLTGWAPNVVVGLVLVAAGVALVLAGTWRLLR